MRGLAEFIMRGRLQATIIISLFGIVSLIIMPMSYVSGAALGLVALRHGIRATIFPLVAASIVVIAGWFAMPAHPAIAFPLIFPLWLPVLICAISLRRTPSQGHVLLIVSAFSALFVIAMHLMVGDVVSWWSEWITKASSQMENISAEGFKKDDTLNIINGLIAIVYGISLMVTVILARWWQSLLYNPGGFQPEFYDLRMPRITLPGVIMLLLLAGSIDQILFFDLFMVAMMMFFFQGLAVIHALISGQRFGRAGLVPLYGGLLFAPQYLIAGLALLGALDLLIDFRRRSSAGKKRE